jgi:hypothetical protein
MNNTIESIENSIMNPPEAARNMFGRNLITQDMARAKAKSIIKARSLAVIAAGCECPANCIGYLDTLTSTSLGQDVCYDSIRMLRGKISDQTWDNLYKAFVDERGCSDGDQYRFLKN